jgi:hypothetical protein
MRFSGTLALGWRLALAVVTVVSCELGPAQATDQSVTLADANRAYAAGDFRMSLKYCNFVLAEDPSPLAHYCRANALVKLGYVSEAKTEYTQAMQLAKDDHLRRYCEAALAAFRSADGTARSHYERANALLKKGDGEGAKAEYERTLLSTKDPVLQKYCFSALTAIQVSADDNNNNAGSINVLSAPAAVRRIAAEREAVTERISSEARDLSRVIRQSEYWHFYGEVGQRTDALTSSSEGLQTQIGARSTGSVHLLQHGTDLYVRNYAVDQTVNPAHAWVSDAASYEKGQFTIPLEATPELLDNVVLAGSQRSGRRGSQSNVFGKLLCSPTQSTTESRPHQ